MISHRLIAIQGPTASGKTSLAIALAQHFKTVIISADSRQFYREMEIGTAKPNLSELNSVPHYFISTNSITEPITAAIYEKKAINLLDELYKVHSTIILVGGSGMFVDALVNGLDPIPTNNEILQNLIKQEDEEGLETLVRELVSLDPEAVNDIDLNNPSRVIRALEVMKITGKTMRSFKTFKPQNRNFDTFRFCINLPREILYERINHRVDLMVKAGLLEEVKKLFSYRDLKPLQTVGYQELFPYFEGEISLEMALEKIKQNSRRYAKRQLTWLRRTKEMNWLEGQDTSSQMDEILKKLK